MRKVFWLGAAAAFIVTSVPSVRADEPQKAPDVQKKLVGSWPLNEGTGLAVKDGSGNGKDGMIQRNSLNVKWVDGRAGKAVEFTAADPAQRNQNGCIEIPRWPT